MNEDQAKEELAKLIGVMRERTEEKLDGMEMEGVTCVPIEDVRLILSGHYNFMYQLVYGPE